MPEGGEQATEDGAPWQQQLYDSIWLWAGVAILFWVLSYIVWGLIDLLTVGPG